MKINRAPTLPRDRNLVYDSGNFLLIAPCLSVLGVHSRIAESDELLDGPVSNATQFVALCE